jgi:Ca-activated chloride channel homolog
MIRTVLVLTGLAGLMMACGAVGDTPSKATVNGYTFSNKAAGQVNLSVSALDSNDRVLSSGTISDPNAASLTEAPAGTTATAKVCGQITGSTSGNLRVAVSLDSTGSMDGNDPPTTENDLTTTKRNQAAKTFVSRMAATDQAAVASFDTSTEATSPYSAIKVTQVFTSNKTLLNTGVDAATDARGGTPLWMAAFDSVDLASAATGNKVALVLTDGGDTEGGKTPEEVINNAKAKGVRVFMIGLGSSLDDSEMQQVAAGTNGLYSSAEDAAQLTGLFNGVFNATQGAGCIETTFAPVPKLGQKVAGTLSFKVNGVPLSAPFNVQF